MGQLAKTYGCPPDLRVGSMTDDIGGPLGMDESAELNDSGFGGVGAELTVTFTGAAGLAVEEVRPCIAPAGIGLATEPARGNP